MTERPKKKYDGEREKSMMETEKKYDEERKSMMKREREPRKI